MDTTNWYAIYVRSRNEKKVYARLLEQGIDAYLPLYKTLRQWSDRKKMVEIPLFSSYVFVNVSNFQFTKVRATEGVVNFVQIGGKPNPVPAEQIENLKLVLLSGEKFEVSTEVFEIGEEVEINKGPLKGFKGQLVNYKNKTHAVLKIDAINQSIMIEISSSFLKKVNNEL